MYKVFLFIFSAVLGAAAVSSTGCSGVSPRGAQEVSFEKDAEGKRKISQTELQQDVQRFFGQFADRVTQASEQIELTRNPELVTRQSLLYLSSGLEIATQPIPEIALLDMIVFVILCRESLEQYWIPEVFKSQGYLLVEAFRRSEDDLWKVAAKVMTDSQKELLLSLIRQWRAENPKQRRVENVRLTDFSVVAGTIEAKRAEQSRGLLAGVSSAVDAADAAVLLADRAMFLAQRMPFLIRLQAVLGSMQIFTNLNEQINDSQLLLQQVQTLGPVMRESMVAANKFGFAAHEARLFTDSLRPFLLPKTGRIGEYLKSTDQIANRTLDILSELQKLKPDQLLGHLTFYLLIVGAGWALFFWTGYYLVKRAYLRQQIRLADRAGQGPRKAA